MEQIGTQENETKGQATYYAWVEFYGDESTQGVKGTYYYQYPISSLTIHPGDTISARVSFVGTANNNSSFEFEIQDSPVIRRIAQPDRWAD